MIALFVSQEENVTYQIYGPSRNPTYVTREIGFINSFRSGAEAGRGGGQ